jgi:Macrocin-O-methyltransferase (TylF)
LKLNNLELIQGKFESEFPKSEDRYPKFGLAHIDCDTYASVSYCEKAVWPYIVHGGYIIFDDANNASCLGAAQAVEEFIIRRRVHSEQTWPHLVFRAGM